MTYLGSRAARADLVVGVVLTLALTGVHYVRRTWLPPGAPRVTVYDPPSRDRALPGKDRIRARRNH